MSYTRKHHWMNNIGFMIIDMAVMFYALLGAFYLRTGSISLLHSSDYARLFCISLLLFICIIFFTDPYDDMVKRGYFQELKKVVVLNTFLMFALFTYLFAIQMTHTYSRIMLSVFYVGNILGMYVAHSIIKHIIRKNFSENRYTRHMILVTTKESIEYCMEQLYELSYSAIQIDGIILIGEKEKGSRIGDIPILGGRDELLPYCMHHVVDEVLFFVDHEEVKEISNRLVDMGIVIHMNIIQEMDKRWKYHVSSVADIPTLTTSINCVPTWQVLLKRAIDIIGGAIGVIATGVIALLIGPIIKRQSPGPLFFCQERIGKNGRRFKIYKFRSMYTDAEERKKELMDQNQVDGFMFKLDNDPRIFPFGHFIRKTSLDEFPQFLNVLRGEMSLVGTRPPTVDEWEQYEMHHHRRLSIKPGVTGMWQVSGRSNITNFEKVVELDSLYIRDWSISLDLKILWKTIQVVLRREGSK